MKLVNVLVDSETHPGIHTDRGIIDIRQTGQKSGLDLPRTMEDLIRAGAAGLRNLEELSMHETVVLPEDSIRYAPCVTSPEKILCVGLNYSSHTKEIEMKIPEYPILFSKFNNALAAHNQEIQLPDTAAKFDYEAELVVVIGKTCRDVSKEEALSYVFGYTVGNDLSARDLQMRSGQWLLGKTCDGFAPVGPYLTTADEIDPGHLDIRCEVNGELKQLGNTSQMLFDCATIISYASQFMTLKPGDILFTGTPEGVVMGYPDGQQQWLKSGDLVSVTIERLGTLTNRLQ